MATTKNIKCKLAHNGKIYKQSFFHLYLIICKKTWPEWMDFLKKKVYMFCINQKSKMAVTARQNIFRHGLYVKKC